jgi:hypothetical protein
MLKMDDPSNIIKAAEGINKTEVQNDKEDDDGSGSDDEEK